MLANTLRNNHEKAEEMDLEDGEMMR